MQSIKVKVLTVFMSLIMAVTMLPALNSNASVVGGLNAVKCGEGAYASLSGDTLTISGTGAIDNYVLYTNNTTNAPWNGDNKFKVKKIVIGEGITSIGNNAFAWTSNLESIEFRSTGALKTIGTQSFYQCYKLTSLKLPYGLVTVGKNAFAYNTALQSVSIPNTVKTIAYGAFACCSNLAKVYIPKSVSSLGDFAFKSNYKLSAVTGGAGLTSIGRQAFEYTYKLRTFSITSKKLSRIGQCCFYCSGLKTIKIKKTTKLKKKKVKGSLYLSSVKTVKVKKSKVRKYRKFFTYRNCGKRRVKVKK